MTDRERMLSRQSGGQVTVLTEPDDPDADVPGSTSLTARVWLDPDGRVLLHLPGKHNQKSHGNKVGKKDLVQTKTGIGRYAYLQRKGTNNAHVGDTIRVLPHSGAPKSISNKEATVVGWDDDRARLEFADGTTADLPKNLLEVVRTSQEIADDATGGDRAGNAKKILEGHYGDRLHLIGKDTERTRQLLNDLARVPNSHHKAVSNHLGGSKTGGIYLGHAPAGDLAPGLEPWKDVKPRGYGDAGGTYADVGGVYIPDSREIAIGVGPHGSGSHSTATHEFGHALDDTLTSEQRKEWRDLYTKLDRDIYMNPYFHTQRNPTGYTSESFAEVYAVWSTGGSVRDAIRSLGEARFQTPEGQEAADAAMAEAFAFFDGIKP